MTRADAIDWFAMLREKFTGTEYGEYLEMAIKALEQTSTLNKIRAEILQIPTISFNANDIYKADVLKIIDKYRVKSEDEV